MCSSGVVKQNKLYFTFNANDNKLYVNIISNVHSQQIIIYAISGNKLYLKSPLLDMEYSVHVVIVYLSSLSGLQWMLVFCLQ